MNYSWKINGIHKANPQEIGEEINSIGNEFTTKDIVNKARNQNTKLHNLFEWNDEIAGEKYREIQAGDIVRNLVIVKRSETGEPQDTNIRVFVSSNQRNGMYKPITSVIRVQEEYELLLEQALKELQAFKNKYANLSELTELFGIIEELAS